MILYYLFAFTVWFAKLGSCLRLSDLHKSTCMQLLHPFCDWTRRIWSFWLQTCKGSFQDQIWVCVARHAEAWKSTISTSNKHDIKIDWNSFENGIENLINMSSRSLCEHDLLQCSLPRWMENTKKGEWENWHVWTRAFNEYMVRE